jgi:hypothetical protein
MSDSQGVADIPHRRRLDLTQVVFSFAIAPQILDSCAAAPGYRPCVTFWRCHLIRLMVWLVGGSHRRTATFGQPTIASGKSKSSGKKGALRKLGMWARLALVPLNRRASNE